MSGRGSALLALSVTILIWASTFVVSVDVLDELGPATLTFARFAIGSLVLLPFGVARGLTARGLLRGSYVVCGLTGIALYYGLQNVGLLFTSPDSAALLQAALPVLTVALSVLWLGESLTARQVVGLVLAVLGMLLVVQRGGLGQLGDLAVITGIAAYAFYTAYVRRTVADADPVVLACASSAWGLVFLAPWLLWELDAQGLPSVSAQTALAVGYLGAAASGLTLLLWTLALRRVPASVAGTFTGGIPALGYVFALLAGELLVWSRLAGGILALAGVTLSSMSGRRR